MRFSRTKSATGTTQYIAEGESFRYTAERAGKDWSLTIRRLETVGSIDPIRVAKMGMPFEEDTHDTLALCKAVATEFEALGDGYRSADHGHRERATEAVIRAYGETTYEFSEVAGHQAPESANVPSVSNTNEENQGENIMAEATATKLDVTEDAGKAALEQITANIERAKSLATEDNTEALEELGNETETIISNLSGKGSIKAKKELRDAWKAAVSVERPVAKVVTGTVETKTWDQYEGTQELAAMGAEKLAEGVTLGLKVSNVAKEVAAIGFDMWTRIPNKSDAPDLMGDSDTAKKATKGLVEMAGKGFEHTYETEQTLKKFLRSIQDQRSDVRAEWLRSLDEDTEEAAERRARVAKILEGKPEGEKASEWVAKHYGTSTIGQGERKKLAYQEKQKLAELEAAGGSSDASGSGEGGGEGEGEGSGADAEAITPDESLEKSVTAIYKAMTKAKPDDFEKASAETRSAQLKRLVEAKEALDKMITALL